MCEYKGLYAVSEEIGVHYGTIKYHEQMGKLPKPEIICGRKAYSRAQIEIARDYFAKRKLYDRVRGFFECCDCGTKTKTEDGSLWGKDKEKRWIFRCQGCTTEFKKNRKGFTRSDILSWDDE